MSSVGIVGFGEIGSSLAKVYDNAKVSYTVRDPFQKLNDSVSDCDVVNVAIPFFGSEQFQQSMVELNLKKGALLIIHSTMRLGTVNQLQNILQDVIVVCSPVRGVHPRLTEGLYTFEKYVGFPDKYVDNSEVRDFVLNHFTSIGLNPVPVKADEAELAKTISTTLYGLNIAAAEDVGRLCDYYGLDFDVVYTRWQQDYNRGYTKLGKANVCRPVLSRIPGESKVIGGHCVVPNAVILNTMEPKEVTGPLANFILRYSDAHSKVHHTNTATTNTTTPTPPPNVDNVSKSTLTKAESLTSLLSTLEGRNSVNMSTTTKMVASSE
jgi:hypothetical protein